MVQLEFLNFIIDSFPILIIVVIMVAGALVVFTRKISDMDDIEEAIDNLETSSKELELIQDEIRTQTKRGKFRARDRNIEKVVRGLHGGVYNPNILRAKVQDKKIEEETILCSNCGISVMAHWEKCYHCENEI